MKNKQQKTTTKPGKHNRLTKEAISKAIDRSFGNVMVVAERLNCNRVTVYDWLNKYPELQAQLNEERENIIDLAENKLITKINNGSESMITFALSRLGKNRGYVEKQEIEHIGKIKVIRDDIKSEVIKDNDK